jgi:sec-independent protein translocase protein TatB|tara:strand:- start:12 stop:614 length:603 start_codon:yes stop_codon:yes gene_type:complete
MFGLGWAEIMLVAIVALIVIGPKELPVVFRKVGQFVGKAKAMAREFTSAMNDAADDSGLKEAADTLNSIKEGVSDISKPSKKNWDDFVAGSETEKLAKKRTVKSKKLRDNMSKKVQNGLDVTENSKSKGIEREVVSEPKNQLESKKNDGKDLLSQVFSESLDEKVHTTKAKAKPKNKVTLKKPSEKLVIKKITAKPGKSQ